MGQEPHACLCPCFLVPLLLLQGILRPCPHSAVPSGPCPVLLGCDRPPSCSLSAVLSAQPCALHTLTPRTPLGARVPFRSEPLDKVDPGSTSSSPFALRVWTFENKCGMVSLNSKIIKV